MKAIQFRIDKDLAQIIKDMADKEKVSQRLASRYVAQEYMNAKMLEKQLDVNLRTGRQRRTIVKIR